MSALLFGSYFVYASRTRGRKETREVQLKSEVTTGAKFSVAMRRMSKLTIIR